jgi:hypothetical protein
MRRNTYYNQKDQTEHKPRGTSLVGETGLLSRSNSSDGTGRNTSGHKQVNASILTKSV